MNKAYQEEVLTKYNIFNSLFLNLPFQSTFRTGTLLPLLAQYSHEGFSNEETPIKIMHEFFDEVLEKSTAAERVTFLFNIIQYVERQVVLFDSIEDAAFDLTHEMDGKGSIKHLLTRIDSEKIRKNLLEKLEDYGVRLVLTAHPTQFYPDKVLLIIDELEDAIKKNDFTEVNNLLMQLGKTGFINKQKPTPYDEAQSLCWYLESVFYEIFPQTLLKLANGLKVEISDLPVEKLLRLGFWPGGDRDGNPFVTPEVSVKVGKLLKKTLLRCYYDDIKKLKNRLTFDVIEEQITAIRDKIYNALYNPSEAKYDHSNHLLEELLTARKVLISLHNGIFLAQLDEFILKVRLFGFYFAALDIRQVSSKHTAAWSQILQKVAYELPIFKPETYETWSEIEKINFLLELNIKIDNFTFDDPITNDILGSIRAIQATQKDNGVQSCERYIISNCNSALSVIEVLALAKLVYQSDHIPLDIVPLFETIEDLANANDIMQTLYQHPFYKKHLAQRAGKQPIMLGFSDGTKDGGYLRANTSIFQAKENITKISRENQIKVIFFDGRGGPPGRGGGNNQAFYASLGKGIENTEIQVTVQGQTISSNYGTLPTAGFNLERLFIAGLENDLFHNEKQGLNQEEKDTLEALAEHAHKAYLDFKNHELFVPYLEKKTPLTFYGASNIGSRPAKRNDASGLKFEDLRAIPFVGCWAQMKQNVPGFYGFGSALAAFKEKGKLQSVKKLYENSLFFRTLVENSMQSLSKADYKATHYLSEDEEYAPFWHKMHDEYERTIALLLEISGQKTLLEANEVSKMSIEIREKIILPIILIQQYALQKLEEASTVEEADVCRKLIIRCMFGIINAARNSA